MDLIDKYVYAIGKKLPYNSRNEIKMELKSLILDEIESSYGNTPTEEEIKKVILDFGSPYEVASRYRKKDSLIFGNYSELYFMLMKIILFALCIAFSVIFFVNLLSNFNNFNLIKNLFNLVSNIFSSSLSAIGALTLVFLIITKQLKDKELNLEIPWDIKELNNIKIEKESKGGIIFELVMTVFFLALINFAPELISKAESSFELSGIRLGHYINIEVFKSLLIIISIIWLFEIIGIIMKLIIDNTKITDFYEILINIANVILLFYLINKETLYLNYNSLFGFRGIFTIIAIIGTLEVIANIFSYIKNYIVNQ